MGTGVFTRAAYRCMALGEIRAVLAPDSSPVPPIGAAIPTLIYDGDCGFCAYWVNYWRHLTGARVTYAPYQKVAAEFPSISGDEFRRAVQYAGEDGSIARG